MISYWSACSIIHGFATKILLERGFASGSIGILLACCYLCAALLQPVIASRMDKSKRFSLTQLVMILGALNAVSLVGLVFGESSRVLTAAMLFLNFAMIYMLQPVTNAIAMVYRQSGQRLNFGVARGLGSLAYATTSALAGKILDLWPGNPVLYFTLAPVVAMLIFARILDRRFMSIAQQDSIVQPRESAAESKSVFGFIAENRRFGIVLIGIALLCTFHNMVETYLVMIMEELGGTTSDTGVALGIAALLELPPLLMINRLRRRFSSSRLMQMAAVGFTLKAICICISTCVLQIELSMLLQAIGYALYIASSVYYVSEIIPAADQLKGQALVTASFTIGGVTGSLLGGVLIEKMGVGSMLIVGLAISAIGTLVVLTNIQRTEVQQEA